MNGSVPRTLADEIRTAGHDGSIVELISGEIVTRAMPSSLHEQIAARIQDKLSSHVEATDLGAVFRLPWPLELSKFDVVRPDVYFVAWRDGVIGVDGVKGTPELVVEVVSPDSRERDLGEKKRLYLWSGVFEYWIVDPDAQTVQGQTKVKNGYDLIPVAGTIFQSVLMPGLELDLDWLFKGRN